MKVQNIILSLILISGLSNVGQSSESSTASIKSSLSSDNTNDKTCGTIVSNTLQQTDKIKKLREDLQDISLKYLKNTQDYLSEYCSIMNEIRKENVLSDMRIDKTEVSYKQRHYSADQLIGQLKSRINDSRDKIRDSKNIIIKRNYAIYPGASKESVKSMNQYLTYQKDNKVNNALGTITNMENSLQEVKKYNQLVQHDTYSIACLNGQLKVSEQYLAKNNGEQEFTI